MLIIEGTQQKSYKIFKIIPPRLKNTVYINIYISQILMMLWYDHRSLFVIFHSTITYATKLYRIQSTLFIILCACVKKLKRHNSWGVDWIPAGDRTIHSEIHKLTNSIWNTNGLSDQCKGWIIVPIYTMGDKTAVVVIEAYYFCKSNKIFYPTFYCQG
jgi:hypothetical protein